MGDAGVSRCSSYLVCRVYASVLDSSCHGGRWSLTIYRTFGLQGLCVSVSWFPPWGTLTWSWPRRSSPERVACPSSSWLRPLPLPAWSRPPSSARLTTASRCRLRMSSRTGLTCSCRIPTARTGTRQALIQIHSNASGESQVRRDQVGSGESQVRQGQVRSGRVWGQVRSGQVRSGWVGPGGCEFRWSGEVRWGQVRSGEVRWGQLRWDELLELGETFWLWTNNPGAELIFMPGEGAQGWTLTGWGWVVSNVHKHRFATVQNLYCSTMSTWKRGPERSFRAPSSLAPRDPRLRLGPFILGVGAHPGASPGSGDHNPRSSRRFSGGAPSKSSRGHSTIGSGRGVWSYIFRLNSFYAAPIDATHNVNIPFVSCKLFQFGSGRRLEEGELIILYLGGRLWSCISPPPTTQLYWFGLLWAEQELLSIELVWVRLCRSPERWSQPPWPVSH